MAQNEANTEHTRMLTGGKRGGDARYSLVRGVAAAVTGKSGEAAACSLA